MAFKRKNQFGTSMVVTYIIDNDDAITVGDLVQLRNGNVEDATAGAALAGVVVDIVDKNGNSISGSLAVLGLATKTGLVGAETVTVGTTNETVDLIAAKIETSKFVRYSASVTGTMNTTTSSDKGGGWVNNVGTANVAETTHSRTITDVRNLKNHGVDPDDSSRMIVSINHSEVWDNGAAMA